MGDQGEKHGEDKKDELPPQVRLALQLMEQQAAAATSTARIVPVEEQPRAHAFWNTQPMAPGDRESLPEGPIVPNKPIEEIRAEPFGMPSGFEWSNVNVRAEIDEVYTLLSNNYVEDDDATFRFDYSPEFLSWAMAPPNAVPDFLFGVRAIKTKKLVAFISGIPATTQVYDRSVETVEINFLCVHKKLRSKRLAPVLIKEMTRRVNRTGVFQAVYTSGTVLPGVVASCRYYHRKLNAKKLVKIGFARLHHQMTLARMQKLCRVPGVTSTPGLRPMEEADVPGVHKLLNQYLTKFRLKILFTEEEILHWMLPRDKVISSFVVGQGNTVTDFISFYHLPSSVLNHNETLYAAYSYYNVATSVDLTELMRDALVLAKECGADVFNALNLMENETFLEALKFGMGDGNLQYYIYNWSCASLDPNQVGIVLL